MRKQLFTLVALSVIALQLVVAASVVAAEEADTGKSSIDLLVEACIVELTDLGRRANFQKNFIYEVSTGSDGKVSSFVRLKDAHPLDDFVRLDQLRCCVKRWILKPNASYVLILRAGTAGGTLERWSLSLCKDDDGCLRILLPRVIEECVDNE